MIRTINDAYLDLRAEFRRKGIAGYQVEARELVSFALGLDYDAFLEKRNQYIFEKDEQKIAELKALRYSGVPLQHITGRWEFYGLPLEVTPDTLIPRADTETLAEVGIRLLQERSKGRMLDLCCGTGCVGMAVLKNVSDGITGVFADLSEPALEVTRHNIVINHLSPRALTYQVNALEPASPDPVHAALHPHRGDPHAGPRGAAGAPHGPGRRRGRPGFLPGGVPEFRARPQPGRRPGLRGGAGPVRGCHGHYGDQRLQLCAARLRPGRRGAGGLGDLGPARP